MKKIIKLFNSLLLRLQLKLKKEPVHYIGNGATLPEPLTKQEEEEVFASLMRGEESAKEKLIIHNLRLVVYIAKKFERSGVSTEDLTSIGTMGLIKAVNTFRPEKNIKLATYASRCIENEILMYLRKIGSRKVEVSIDEPLNTDSDGNELLLSDILASEADTVSHGVEYEDEKKMLLEAVNSLDEREKQLMYLRFGFDGGEEHTQKEVADIMGISQSYISRLEKKIILSLKETLTNQMK
ncbi:MAG: sigma-70 family RNA polymerase sigma factor [Ruminococcaceae bacterium]|nr:sigma-70 family RNA polymerase sigma factor [Oscillospiraceae bacterium]